MLNAEKDKPTTTPEWDIIQTLIDGVTAFEMKNVLGTRQRLTEVFRPEWEPSGLPVAHVFQVLVYPGNTPNWHCHKFTLDRLFCALGQIKLVLFDGRTDSPTYRRINEFNLGEARPALVAIPPGVWHALQCCGQSSALVINMASHAYQYGDPDHYRLPANAPEIPYTWR